MYWTSQPINKTFNLRGILVSFYSNWPMFSQNWLLCDGGVARRRAVLHWSRQLQRHEPHYRLKFYTPNRHRRLALTPNCVLVESSGTRHWCLWILLLTVAALTVSHGHTAYHLDAAAAVDKERTYHHFAHVVEKLFMSNQFLESIVSKSTTSDLSRSFSLPSWVLWWSNDQFRGKFGG